MLEWSVLAAFGAMICWGLGDFFIQRSTRQIGNVESLAWIGVIGSVLLLPFVWNDLALLVQPQNALFFVGLGALTFIVALINFEALKEGKLSVIDVILEIELPITVGFGIVFLAEAISLVQWFAIAFVFAGIVMISLPKLSISKSIKQFEKGIGYALLAAVGLGILNFWTGVGAKTFSPFLVIWVPWAIFGVLCLIIIAKREGFARFFQNAKKFKKTILAESLLDTAAWVLFAIALSTHAISIVTAITESYPALAVLLGVFINKEKIQQHQWAGAVLALAGSVWLGIGLL